MPTEKNTTTETLLERSQRILGVSLDSPDPDDRSDSASAAGNDSRRKAQVSQAQRTHRRRTQRYIRELENEVLRVRARERSAVERIRALETQLRSQSIEPIPRESSVDPFDSSQSVNDIIFNLSPSSSQDTHTPSIKVDLSALNEVQAEYACCDTASEKLPPDIALLNQIPSSIEEVRQKRQSADPQQAQMLIALNAQTAIDFILQLERPCFPHIRYAIEHPNCRVPSRRWLDNAGGPDHVFTAARSLLSAQPTLDEGSHAQLMSFEISEAQVEELLAASSRLDLEDELTPVQVWKEVVQKSENGMMQGSLLQGLAASFQRYSFCNSYGAVVNKTVVDVVMGCFFPVYLAHFNSQPMDPPPGCSAEHL